MILSINCQEFTGNHNMEKIELKEATAADAEDYIKLEKKVGGRTYSALTTEDKFLQELGRSTIYLALINGKTIGHILFRSNNDGTVHLGRFIIEPEFQGRGYGRQVFGLIMEKAKGAAKIDLVTHPDNIKAINLYQSFGFEVAERRENYCGDGEPRLVLIKH